MNYVFTLRETDLERFIDFYQEHRVDPGLEHVLARFQSKQITVTLYRSGKVLLQGDSAYEDYLMWSDILGFTPEKQPDPVSAPCPEVGPSYSSLSEIGSDEVGTGDFFGPVVVSAAFVPDKEVQKLHQMGVRDSKQLTDESILKLNSALKAFISHVVLVTPPQKYNELVRSGFNLNKIKAYLHNHAIRKLAQKHAHEVQSVIVDEFCSPENYYAYLADVETYRPITFVQKAESSHIAVAMASIFARASFLDEMEKINQLTGIAVPLGASQAVDLIGKRIALERGLDFFDVIAKTNFKNMDKIKAMCPINPSV